MSNSQSSTATTKVNKSTKKYIMPHELEYLNELVLNHVDVIKDQTNTGSSKWKKEKAWKEIQDRFDLQSAVQHNILYLKKTWQNAQMKAKTYCDLEKGDDEGIAKVPSNYIVCIAKCLGEDWNWLDPSKEKSEYVQRKQ
jgi:hypothetical protein